MSRRRTVTERLQASLARVAQRGLGGKIRPDEAPGYAIGVKAADALLRDPEPSWRPVAVNIILTTAPVTPRLALAASTCSLGVILHMDMDER